jgi:nucleotide-binding universal stress UspA family protein
MNKILVPCDFSETSENALNYAIELAKYLSCELILLHINQITAVSSEFGMTAYPLSEMASDSKKILHEIADGIKKREPLISNITHYSEIGNATDVIVEYSSKEDVVLTVMGINGHGNKLMKLFFGSTAVNVSRNIEKPVIIVPPAVKYKKIQNIAYACDYDKNIETNLSLIQLKYINALLGADLHVLHVIPQNHELNKQESHVDCYVEQKLENAAHKTFIISDDDVTEGLLEFISNHDIDIIIVEPKKHSFFHNIFYPSITNEIAFFSPLPVLTIHG